MAWKTVLIVALVLMSVEVQSFRWSPAVSTQLDPVPPEHHPGRWNLHLKYDNEAHEKYHYHK